MTKIKICGITNLEDAKIAVESGADALGFIFVPSSPRAISIDKAARIISQLGPFISTVGVFVNPSTDEIKQAAGIIDIIQLHGEETPQFCQNLNKKFIKAFRVKDSSSLSQMENFAPDAYLLDTYAPDKRGGTGRVFDWSLAIEAKKYGRIILSGGLTPDNIVEAIKRVSPYGIDASSGIEAAPGKKNPEKLKEFIRLIRNLQI